MKHTQSLRERFEAKVRITPSCWLWMGGRLKAGYGVIWRCGRNDGAHRVSYEIHVGSIPAGLVVRHRCDNPQCVNPDHLELGTSKDNAQDRKQRRRQAIRVGERNQNARLSESVVLSIRTDSRKQSVIAQAYGITQSNVSHIKRGASWGHLGKE